MDSFPWSSLTRPQKLFASWRQRIDVDRLIVIVPPILDRAADERALLSFGLLLLFAVLTNAAKV